MTNETNDEKWSQLLQRAYAHEGKKVHERLRVRQATPLVRWCRQVVSGAQTVIEELGRLVVGAAGAAEGHGPMAPALAGAGGGLMDTAAGHVSAAVPLRLPLTAEVRDELPLRWLTLTLHRQPDDTITLDAVAFAQDDDVTLAGMRLIVERPTPAEALVLESNAHGVFNVIAPADAALARLPAGSCRLRLLVPGDSEERFAELADPSPLFIAGRAGR